MRDVAVLHERAKPSFEPVVGHHLSRCIVTTDDVLPDPGLGLIGRRGGYSSCVHPLCEAVRVNYDVLVGGS